jgi:hypothetical protein
MLGFTLAELAQEASVTETRLKSNAVVAARAGTGTGVGHAPAAGGRLRAEPQDAAPLSRGWKPSACKSCCTWTDPHLIALVPQPHPPERGARFRLAAGRADPPLLPHRGPERIRLDSGFDKPEQSLAFTCRHADGKRNLARMQAFELRQLRARFAELHEESLARRCPRRRGSGLLHAVREWEPATPPRPC